MDLLVICVLVAALVAILAAIGRQNKIG